MKEKEILGKVPPYNLDAEMACLGSMLMDSETVAEGIEKLNVKDFYKEAHRKIFSAIVSLFDKGQPIDLVTITAYLRDRNQLDSIGGAEYLTAIMDSVPTSANFSHYYEIVIDKSVLRKLINAANQIIASSLQTGDVESISEILDRAEQAIFEITSRKIQSDFVRVGDMMKDVVGTIDELYKRKEHITGIPTGLHDLDLLTSGFQPSDFIVIAARPTMGKTSLALNIAEYATIKKNIPVGFFSLEMSKEQIIYRILGSLAGVNVQHISTGYLSKADWPKLVNAASEVSEAPFYIDDTAGSSIMDLRAKARRAVSKYGIKMIIIDYLQLMTTSSIKYENRQTEIAAISRSLKSLARELHIPVLALSQLSRKVESRENKKPVLSDLRESGAIEQDADMVIFIHHPSKKEDEEEEGQAVKCSLIIAKHRNGPVGERNFYFYKDITKFENAEYEPVEVE